MTKNGVPIMAVSAANEPSYVARAGTALWTAEELTAFVGQTWAHLRPALSVAEDHHARHGQLANVGEYVTSLLADSAAKNLSVVATHPYQNGSTPIVLDYKKPAENGKALAVRSGHRRTPRATRRIRA